MRVIAGALKGRRLKTPHWDGVRPTSDKLRETLFNILGGRTKDARVADVYAGTGAVGIEALSRGARSVVFVDDDPRAQALVVENLARCGLADRYTMVRSDARRALESFEETAAFDVVFLDPPYGSSASEIAGALAAAGERLAPGGVAVLERSRRQPAPDATGSLVRVRDVISGDSALTFYEFRR